MRHLPVFFLLAISIACSPKKSEETDSEEITVEEKLGADADLLSGQRVYFKNIENGAQLTSPIQIEMGVEGMEIEPAGELSYHKGHHHLLINDQSTEKGKVVPADSTHIHYGKGQTEAEISLPPGSHTIRLQFADGFHQSYGPQMSTAVEVTIIE